MVNTLILSDEDGDGITSARIVQLATDAEVVLFKEDFSIEDKDIDTIKSYKPKNVYVLDIGSDAEMLQKLADLSEEIQCNVNVIDNHPPEDISHFDTFFGTRTKVLSSNNNCTAGIAYGVFEEIFAENKRREYWAEVWTLLGLHSDVKAESREGKPIVDKLLPKHPELFGKVLTPKKSSSTESGWTTDDSSNILRQLVTIVNVPKRSLYHFGAYLMYNALTEIEKANNIFALWEPIDENSVEGMKFKTLMPNTYILRKEVDNYYEKAKTVFSSDNDFKFWDFDYITVSQIRHPWNLGGYVANLKSPDRKKTHFCINLGGIDPKRYKITARSDNRSKEAKNIDVGKVFSRATEISNGKLKGGGLKQAGSAMVDRDFSPLEAIRCLVQASQEVSSGNYEQGTN